MTLLLLGIGLTILASPGWARLVRYDQYSGRPLTTEQENFFRDNNLFLNCTREIEECRKDEGRRVDGSCNNFRHPSRGTAQGPYIRLLPAEFGPGFTFRKTKSGQDLPSARKVRTTVMTDGLVESRKRTQLLSHFLLGAISDITAIILDVLFYVILIPYCCLPAGNADPRCIPIDIPADDPHLRLTGERCMNLTRINTFQRFGCLPLTQEPERVNLGTPMVDLSNVYGPSDATLNQYRLNESGLLVFEIEGQKIWPRSQMSAGNIVQSCINNQAGERRCHDTPTPAVNGLLSINLYYIWFYREHNRIATELAKINPCWTDDQLFNAARKINIAQHQHISFYETWATVMGYKNLMEDHILYPDYGHIDDYNESLEPGVTLEFVTTTRWFHTIVNNKLKLYDNKGKYLRFESAVDLTLRTGLLPNNETIERLTQGSFRQPCASNNHVLDTEMGERVLGPQQRISDIIAVDLQRHREFGFPSYNKYRKFCGLKEALKFEDFSDTIGQSEIESLTELYETPDDVELYTAILIEKPLSGADIGPTLYCIMADQLQRWRRADRFWFEHPHHPDKLTLDQVLEIKKTSAARILCDSGDYVYDIQPRALDVATPFGRNAIKDCRDIPFMDLTAWKDDRCQSNKQNIWTSRDWDQVNKSPQGNQAINTSSILQT